MPLIYLYIYGIVTVLLLGVLSYFIGHSSHDMSDGDIFFNATVGTFIVLFWPLILAIAIVLAPFMGPYYLGKRHHRIKDDKKKMWYTLKR